MTASNMSSGPPIAPPLRAVVTGASSGIGRSTAIELARRLSRVAHRGSAGTDTLSPDTASLEPPSPAAVSAAQPLSRSSLSSSSPSSPSSDGSRDRVLVHFHRNRQGAASTAGNIRALGVAAEVVQADLCDAGDRRKLIDRAWSFLEHPTTWINNAGADVLTGEAGKMNFLDKLRLLLEVDLVGTMQLSRGVGERWLDELAGELVAGASPAEPGTARPSALPPSMTFIGWDQAPLGMEGDAGQMFGPVKAAVMAFAASLAQELAPHVRVNTVAPGWIKTAWGESTDRYWDGRARRQSLMNRWGRPEDVAAAVCYVSDPQHSFCTGQTICVNGGWNRNFPP